MDGTRNSPQEQPQIEIAKGPSTGRTPEDQQYYQSVQEGIDQQRKSQEERKNYEQQIRHKQQTGQLLTQEEIAWLRSSQIKEENLANQNTTENKNQAPPQKTQEEEEYFRRLMQDINQEDGQGSHAETTEKPDQENVGISEASSLKEAMAENEEQEVIKPPQEKLQSIVQELETLVQEEPTQLKIEDINKAEALLKQYKEKIQRPTPIQETPQEQENLKEKGIKRGWGWLIEDEAETNERKPSIADKLNSEDVSAALNNRNPIKVRVKRSNGQIENDWVVMGVNSETGKARVFRFPSQEEENKGMQTIYKDVPLEELKEVNSDNTTKEDKTEKEAQAQTETENKKNRGWDWLKEEDKTEKNLNNMVHDIYNEQESQTNNFGEIGDSIDLIKDLNLNKQEVNKAIKEGQIQTSQLNLTGDVKAQEYKKVLEALNKLDLGTVDLSTPENTKVILEGLAEVDDHIQSTKMSGPGEKDKGMTRNLAKLAAISIYRELN